MLNFPARRNKVNLEHGEAIDNLGESKVGDLDAQWVVFCQKDVLSENELSFLVGKGTARYLKLEIAVHNALGVDVL